MPKEKNCDCCGAPFERGVTVWITGQTIGRQPFAAGKATRIRVCESCDLGANPVLARLALGAVRGLLDSVALEFQQQLSRKALGSGAGPNNSSGAGV